MITFYPTISCGELGKYAQSVTRMLLPVSSWAGSRLKQQEKRGLSTASVLDAIPVPLIPNLTEEVAADCGGFVATLKWGDYRYTSGQYVEWLHGIGSKLSWAATMDYCCEPEVVGKEDIVRERQDKTTAMASLFWQQYRDVPWMWVPTIQGWTVKDYERHAHEMKPLIDEIHAYYGRASAFRVGIGTLCRRASTEMIHEVVNKVTRILDNVPLHLWGVKLGLVQSPLALPSSIVSVDSGAWNGMFGRGRERWKDSGYSQRAWCFKVALKEYVTFLRIFFAVLKKLFAAL